jgi:tight adherence protein B
MPSYISDETVFILMVFIAAFLLAQSLITPTFGENRRARKRLKKRLKAVRESFKKQEVTSLLREKYLRRLSPFERFLESLPGMAELADILERSGSRLLAYRFVLVCLGVLATGFMGAWIFSQELQLSLIIGLGSGVLPIFKLRMDRAKRLLAFEEQLPDALSIMTRALRAGHPFTGTLQLVAEEMEGPVAKEFGIVFTDVNYGGDLREAMNGLLERVPSVTVMAFVTAVMIQKESGGNLAEVLEKLTALVRSRFRFQRLIRTYSAQGRMSAWVLVLLPFVLAGLMTLVAPEYIPMMTKDPTGRKLILLAFGLMIAGILWVGRIVRIEV